MILRAGARIAVVRGKSRSGSADDFVGCPPVAYVHVAAGAQMTHDGTVYEALIDTGSDVTVISEEVVKKIGATLTGNGVVRGFGGSRAGVQRAYVNIIFPTAGLSFQAPNAGVLDLKSVGTFDVILGRAFLSHCRLTVDGPNGDYQLEWVA